MIEYYHRDQKARCYCEKKEIITGNKFNFIYDSCYCHNIFLVYGAKQQTH